MEWQVITLRKKRICSQGSWRLTLIPTVSWTTLCRTGFVAGQALMFLACCMVDAPLWLMTVSGIGGGVLALACAGGTGWCEGSDTE